MTSRLPTERAASAAESASTASPPPIVELTLPECHEVLARQRLCVLSVVDGSAPYAVPVYYGFDGQSLYLGVSVGRKTQALEVNPQVHIVVTEAEDGDRWRSVAIAGRVTVLSDPEERARGIDALIAHNRRSERKGVDRGPAAPARRSGGRVFRIDDTAISGRARR